MYESGEFKPLFLSSATSGGKWLEDYILLVRNLHEKPLIVGELERVQEGCVYLLLITSFFLLNTEEATLLY